MDDHRDVAIIVLAVLVATCLIIFVLEIAQPTGRLVEALFPRV